jgi:hypothetical protein
MEIPLSRILRWIAVLATCPVSVPHKVERNSSCFTRYQRSPLINHSITIRVDRFAQAPSLDLRTPPLHSIGLGCSAASEGD